MVLFFNQSFPNFPLGCQKSYLCCGAAWLQCGDSLVGVWFLSCYCLAVWLQTCCSLTLVFLHSSFRLVAFSFSFCCCLTFLLTSGFRLAAVLCMSYSSPSWHSLVAFLLQSLVSILSLKISSVPLQCGYRHVLVSVMFCLAAVLQFPCSLASTWLQSCFLVMISTYLPPCSGLVRVWLKTYSSLARSFCCRVL